MFKKVSLDGEVLRKISDAGKELLEKLLTTRPEDRITAHEALNHRWFSSATLSRQRSNSSNPQSLAFHDSNKAPLSGPSGILESRNVVVQRMRSYVSGSMRNFPKFP